MTNTEKIRKNTLLRYSLSNGTTRTYVVTCVGKTKTTLVPEHESPTNLRWKGPSNRFKILNADLEKALELGYYTIGYLIK